MGRSLHVIARSGSSRVLYGTDNVFMALSSWSVIYTTWPILMNQVLSSNNSKPPPIVRASCAHSGLIQFMECPVFATFLYLQRARFHSLLSSAAWYYPTTMS